MFVCLFVFNHREEKDAFVDENDILNSDSFVSGINNNKKKLHGCCDPVLYSRIHTCLGDLGISSMSPPARKPKAESKFVPGFVIANQSTPRLAALSAVSTSSRRKASDAEVPRS